MVLLKHLVVDISAHGFGHVAQTAAVLNCLPPDLKLTVRTSATNQKPLQERVHRPFEMLETKLDTGMIMYDALSVDVEETMNWYRHFHLNYSQRRADEAELLAELQADCLLSNVPYLSLDAAGLAGIPNVALCSLNWADIFLSYCQGLEGSYEIHKEIQEAYAQTNLFLQPEPSMPMNDMPTRRPIAPIARVGERRDLSSVVFGAGESTKFVLVGVGGMELKQISFETWPALKDCFWIWPDSMLKRQFPIANRRDFLAQSFMEECFPYIDILASSHLVITKTGYGTQTEAVVNGVPCICINRLDWPEHEYLKKWHSEHGEVVFCDLKDLEKTVSESNHLLPSAPCNPWNEVPVPLPTGAKEAAEIIVKEFLS